MSKMAAKLPMMILGDIGLLASSKLVPKFLFLRVSVAIYTNQAFNYGVCGVTTITQVNTQTNSSLNVKTNMLVLDTSFVYFESL